MTVDETIKGSAGRQVDFIDKWSVDHIGGDHEWDSSIGSCPVDFRFDPSGDYVIMGLHEGERDALITREIFFWGDEPSGEQYEAAKQRMGGFPDDTSRADFPVFIVAGLGATGLIASALVVWQLRFRRRRSIEG